MALLLTLALGLPNSAFALRVPEAGDAGGLEEVLHRALDPSAGGLEEPDETFSDLAGLEEPGDDPAVEAVVRQMHALADGGDWAGAFRLLEDAIRTDPDHAADYRVRQGRLLLQLGRIHEARDLFAAVLAQDPKNVRALVGQASCLRAFKQSHDAMALLDHAIALQPTYAKAWAVRSRLHAAQEDYERADADAREAQRLDPESADGWVAAAHAWYGRQRFAEADEMLDEALSRRPHHPGALMLRVKILIAEGLRSDAARVATTALSKHPYSAGLGNALVDVFRDAGDDATANMLADRIARQRPEDPVLWKAWAEVAYDTAHRSEAVTALEAYHQLFPRDAAARKRLAQWAPEPVMAEAGLEETVPAAAAKLEIEAVKKLAAEERWTDALRTLDMAIATDSTSATLLTERAHLLIELGRAGEALDDLDAALEMSPNNVRALLMRSKAHRVLKHFGAAAADAQAAWRVGSRSIEALIAISKVWQSQGIFDQAGEVADYALALDPTNVHAMVAKVEAVYQRGQGHLSDALALTNAAVARDSTDVAARLLQVKLLHDLTRRVESVTAAQQLLRERPGDVRLLWFLMDFYVHLQRDRATAHEVAQPWLASPPTDAALGKAWAAVLDLLGRREEAIVGLVTYLREFPRDGGAMKLLARWRGESAAAAGGLEERPKVVSPDRAVPEDPGYHIRIAERLQRTKDHEGVIRTTRHIIQLNGGPDDPRNVYAYILQARAHMALKQHEPAEQDWTWVIAHSDPKDLRNIPSLLQRAKVRLDLGKLTEAEEDAQKAFALDSQSVSILVRLAEVYSAQGRHQDAEAAATQALDLDSTSLGAQIERAIARKAQGRLDEAQEDLAAVLTRAPGNAYAHEVLGGVYRAQGFDQGARVEHETAVRLRRQKSSFGSAVRGGLEEWGVRAVFGLGRVRTTAGREAPAPEDWSQPDDLFWYS